MSKEHLKKTGDELQGYLLFRRRGSYVSAKKGKGAKYKRSEEKKKMLDALEDEEGSIK